GAGISAKGRQCFQERSETIRSQVELARFLFDGDLDQSVHQIFDTDQLEKTAPSSDRINIPPLADPLEEYLENSHALFPDHRSRAHDRAGKSSGGNLPGYDVLARELGPSVGLDRKKAGVFPDRAVAVAWASEYGAGAHQGEVPYSIFLGGFERDARAL